MKKAAEPNAKATKMEDTEAQEDQDKIEEEKHEDDEEQEEEHHMSKEEAMKKIKEKMKKMSVEKLNAAYKMMGTEMNMKKDDEDDMKKEEVDQSTIEDRLASVDVSDDVNALTSNEDL